MENNAQGVKDILLKIQYFAEFVEPILYKLEWTAGLWEESTGTIIIKRDQLYNIENYAGILLHEVAHAKSGASDVKLFIYGE